MKPRNRGFFRRHSPGTAAGLKLLFSEAFMLTAFAAAVIAPWCSAWADPLTVLHSFADCAIVKCPTDGMTPFAGVIMDGAGNLYGTTWGGGTFKGWPSAPVTLYWRT